MSQTKKLLSQNQTLNLELAGVIVSNNLDIDFTEIEYFQKELTKTFNHNYTKEEIQQSLDLLLGQQEQEDQIIVYPDDHITGI
jgi:hypothetical protein